MALKMSVARDPRAGAYVDLALTRVSDENDAALELLTNATGAGAAIAHIKKLRL